MIVFILNVLLLAWVSFTIGFCLIGTELKLAKRLKRSLWNGRIDELGKDMAGLKEYARQQRISVL